MPHSLAAVRSSTVSTDSTRSRTVRTWILVTATATTGLMAGFFYTYMCSVMRGLELLDDRAFIDAMQSINATVRNTWFGISFFGALLLTTAAVLVHLRRPTRRVLPWVGAAFVLYAIAFGITMGISVPLNEELAAAGDPAAIADPAAVRAGYEVSWNNWNLGRTLASGAAFACMIGAQVVHGRPAGVNHH